MMRKRSRMSLGGTRVDVWDRCDVLAEVAARLRETAGPPLLLASANLDHISHFGPKGCSGHLVDFDEPSLRWLVLLDGVPLVWRSRRLLDGDVEQLAGSDLLSDVLDVAYDQNARVGIFGGSPETHELVRQVLANSSPGLLVVECWAPTREELSSPARCRELAAKIAAADVHLLVVALGKPRQEHFLAAYGLLTQVRVAVAFGAAIDFLAGQVQRAPVRVRHAGLEWLWRLAQEPRRLARRYLVAGPPGAVALLRDSRILWTGSVEAPAVQASVPQQRTDGARWTGADRRQGQRRSGGPEAVRPALDGIPEQRHGERRNGADRRTAVMAEV